MLQRAELMGLFPSSTPPFYSYGKMYHFYNLKKYTLSFYKIFVGVIFRPSLIIKVQAQKKVGSQILILLEGKVGLGDHALMGSPRAFSLSMYYACSSHLLGLLSDGTPLSLLSLGGQPGSPREGSVI